jgi:hypothetical protein
MKKKLGRKALHWILSPKGFAKGAPPDEKEFQKLRREAYTILRYAYTDLGPDVPQFFADEFKEPIKDEPGHYRLFPAVAAWMDTIWKDPRTNKRNYKARLLKSAFPAGPKSARINAAFIPHSHRAVQADRDIDGEGTKDGFHLHTIVSLDAWFHADERKIPLLNFLTGWVIKRVKKPDIVEGFKNRKRKHKDKGIRPTFKLALYELHHSIRYYREGNPAYLLSRSKSKDERAYTTEAVTWIGPGRKQSCPICGHPPAKHLKMIGSPRGTPHLCSAVKEDGRACGCSGPIKVRKCVTCKEQIPLVDWFDVHHPLFTYSRQEMDPGPGKANLENFRLKEQLRWPGLCEPEWYRMVFTPSFIITVWASGKTFNQPITQRAWTYERPFEEGSPEGKELVS